MRERELKALSEFLSKFQAKMVTTGTARPDLPADVLELNRRINLEELDETLDAVKDNDLIEIADGCADVLYVITHATVQLGRTPNAARAIAAGILLARAKTAIEMALGSGINLARDEETDRGLAFAEIIIRGVAATYDLPLEKLFDEVHSSNMSKVWEGGEIRKDEGGKVIKPPTYRAADIARVLSEHRED